jgi:hypothetical protein
MAKVEIPVFCLVLHAEQNWYESARRVIPYTVMKVQDCKYNSVTFSFEQHILCSRYDPALLLTLISDC